ncbi:MarC family protein [Paraburkholderia sediminicola]|uniref:MarC family protein n=1 Tax=Paraburkholderia sediminicola TaxID=458836 RepID=UPI0038BBDFCA
MTFDSAFATKVFAAMFAIMNPIANIPVFLSLTDGASAAVQRRISFTAIAGVSIGCLVSVLAGGAILGAFGLTVQDFRLAGGLLVLLIALSMLHGSASKVHSGTPAEQADTPGPENVAIYPLTIPLLVGPGTIATLIIFGQTARDEGKIIELGLGLSCFLVVLAVSLLLAPSIGRRLSSTATAITRRLMGMILAAIAMQMIVVSLQALFPSLAR